MKKNIKKFIKDNKNSVILFIIIFFLQTIVYCLTKLIQGVPIYLNNWLDDLIPFIPSFIIFYISWYPLLLLIPMLILKYDKKVFDRYIVTMFMFAIFEGIIFTFLPTTMTRYPVEVTNISTFIINIIYMVDTPVNLFPSAHCAYAILFIVSVLDLKKLKKEYKILISIISVLIVLSTLFIKQHIVIDVLGALVVIPIYYILKKMKINIEKSGIYAKIFCQK